MKTAAKRLIGRHLKRDFLEKLTEYAIAEREDAVTLAAAADMTPAGTAWEPVVERGREALWRATFACLPSPDVLLLEFGSWQGDSMRYLASLNASPRSRFFGFDSFEGLPEDWRGMPAERFDRQGRIPHSDDDRVSFVKGWFRDTLPGRLDALAALAADRAVIVHFDADLYSSTLYLLFTLSRAFPAYHFIFDEFSGHETRALFNFIQATGASADYLHKVDWQGFPQVVSGTLRLPGG